MQDCEKESGEQSEEAQAGRREKIILPFRLLPVFTGIIGEYIRSCSTRSPTGNQVKVCSM